MVKNKRGDNIALADYLFYWAKKQDDKWKKVIDPFTNENAAKQKMWSVFYSSCGTKQVYNLSILFIKYIRFSYSHMNRWRQKLRKSKF